MKQITAQLSHACSNRGADMGRPSFMADNPFAVKFHLHTVPLDSGGYDSGGAYWGFRRAGERLYRAVSLIFAGLVLALRGMEHRL